MDPAGRQIGQRHVRMVEGIAGSHHMQPVLSGEAQEVVTVLAGIGGDAAELPFLEQMLLVAQYGNVGEVDTGHRQGAAPVQRSQCRRHQLPGGGEQDRGVDRLRWWIVGAAR